MSDEQTRLPELWVSASDGGYLVVVDDCDYGRVSLDTVKPLKYEPVPWCETHDEPMHRRTDHRTCRQGWASGCKLQDPPKVWRETDE